MTTIGNFKGDELSYLVRQFSEIEKPITISGPVEEKNLFHFYAKNEKGEILVTYANKDPYHAKGHFIEKLRENLKKIKKHLPTADWANRKAA